MKLSKIRELHESEIYAKKQFFNRISEALADYMLAITEEFISDKLHEEIDLLYGCLNV